MNKPTREYCPGSITIRLPSPATKRDYFIIWAPVLDSDTESPLLHVFTCPCRLTWPWGHLTSKLTMWQMLVTFILLSSPSTLHYFFIIFDNFIIITVYIFHQNLTIISARNQTNQKPIHSSIKHWIIATLIKWFNIFIFCWAFTWIAFQRRLRK